MNPAEFHDRCEALKQRYPDQFVGMPLDMVGFSPGWTNIVERLCQSIDEVLEDEDRPNFHWVQIKEKYGGLRAYYVPKDVRQKNLIDALIKTAESESESTCEECGQPGTTVSVRQGWVRTLCVKHHNEALVIAMQTPEAKAAARALFNQQEEPPAASQTALCELAGQFGVVDSVWTIEQRNGQRVAVCRGTRKMACYQKQLDALKGEAEKLLSMPVEIIHLASRDPVLRDGLAALEETQGRYGPALAKLAMHVDGGRDHHTVSTLVAIDTEFTDLHSPFPVSIGLARIDTGESFYAEFSECLTDELAQWSYFAEAHVKPLLSRETMESIEQAAPRLFEWLSGLPLPVILITDAPQYDVTILQQILGPYRLKYLRLQVCKFHMYSAGIEHNVALNNARMKYFNASRPQHHALHDALAMREQVLAAMRMGWSL
jgi:hypothetical protein